MAETAYGTPEVLFEDEQHKCIWLGAGLPANEQGMPSNQYLIIDGDEGYLLDPGGYYLFDRIFANVERFIKAEQIKGIFLSHQDPDVCGAIARWIEKLPQAEIIMSDMWIRFMMHLPLDEVPLLRPLKDEGGEITLPSGASLRFLPAHYLHSPGNFQLYDSRAKILFSGDMGASVMEERPTLERVESLKDHEQKLEGFHQRFLGSNAAVRFYLANMERLGLEIEMLCPQHGAIFVGVKVITNYFTWLSTTDVGIDYLKRR